MRVRPTPLIGILIAVGYGAYFLIAELVGGVDYDAYGDSTSNIITAIVVPVVIGAVLLAVLTTALGWWRPALFDETRGPRWGLIVPVLMIVSILISLATSDWGAKSTSLVTWLLIGTLFVGFSEEMAYRGLTLVGLRGSWSETWVWFTTSLLFGLLHGLNLFTGQSLAATVQQIVFAFVFGTVFYVVRRVSGTLILGMVIHGFWDFSTFLRDGDDTSGTALLAGFVGSWFSFAAAIIAFVILVKLLREDRLRRGAGTPVPVPA